MKNRPERLICFLVVWLTMFSFNWGSGQIPYPQMLKNDFSWSKYPGFLDSRIPQKSSFFVKNAGETVNTPAYFSPNVYAGQPERPSNGLYTQPANLYYLHSGFFCKREWEFEKTTHVPFRFRLGSLADCNALEGKH